MNFCTHTKRGYGKTGKTRTKRTREGTLLPQVREFIRGLISEYNAGGGSGVIVVRRDLLDKFRRWSPRSVHWSMLRLEAEGLCRHLFRDHYGLMVEERPSVRPAWREYHERPKKAGRAAFVWDEERTIPKMRFSKRLQCRIGGS